MEIIVKVAGFV